MNSGGHSANHKIPQQWNVLSSFPLVSVLTLLCFRIFQRASFSTEQNKTCPPTASDTKPTCFPTTFHHLSPTLKAHFAFSTRSHSTNVGPPGPRGGTGCGEGQCYSHRSQGHPHTAGCWHTPFTVCLEP